MDKEEGFAPDLTYFVFIHSAFLPSLNHTYIHTYILGMCISDNYTRVLLL